MKDKALSGVETLNGIKVTGSGNSSSGYILTIF
jgi:hypothetical protein